MSASTNNKRFGIVVKMPDNDPMAASHLLGEGWSSERWFDTVEARDRALESMQKNPEYYRKGDKPSVVLSKVEAEK